MSEIYTKSEVTRFWSYVTKRKKNECWEWNGGKLENGYGQMWVNDVKRSIGSHVFSLAIKIGRRLVKGECSLHRCDNPSCVNPGHLFLGTKGVNNSDRKAKGRNSNRQGTLNPQAKMNPKKVRQIRKICNDPNRTKSIASHAADFGITDMAFIKIGRHQNWTHIK